MALTERTNPSYMAVRRRIESSSVPEATIAAYGGIDQLVTDVHGGSTKLILNDDGDVVGLVERDRLWP